MDWALEACFHLSASTQTPDNGSRSAQGKERWKPPAKGTLKVNIDGAFVQDTCTGAAGAVVCMAEPPKLYGPCAPVIVLKISEALTAAHESQITPIVYLLTSFFGTCQDGQKGLINRGKVTV
jgi:hypothetical protein